MRSLHPGIALGLCWFCAAVMGAENQWVCVPGEAGRWRCGHDEQALQAIPLEAPKPRTDPTDVPRNSPYSKPRMPWQPSRDDIAQRQPALGMASERPATLPLDPSLSPVAPDHFVLRLVSVSNEQDVREFVEDFEIDPNQVRYTRVSEDGNQRYLIVYGAYPNEQRARYAIAVLPASMRAIQPKPVVASSFENPLEDLLETPAGQIPMLAASETPGNSDSPTKDQAAVPDLAVATAEPPTARISTVPIDPGLDDVVEDSNPQEPVLVLTESEIPEDLDASNQNQTAAAELVVAIAEQPVNEFSTSQLDTRSDDANEHASPQDQDPVLTESAGDDRAEDSGRAVAIGPATLPATSTPLEQEPQVAATRALVLAETEPVPDPPAVAPEIVVDTATVVPLPTKQELDIPTPVASKASFGSIDPGYFTMQLSSQKSEESAARFIARHGLDRNRLHLVLIDEGAGARWLVLYSQFADLEAVEASKYLIPSGIRSPWARRIAPLQQNLIRSR